MNIRDINIKWIVVFSIIFCSINESLFAQEVEEEKDGEVEAAEVLITKDRQLTLPVIEKIFEKIKVVDNQPTPEFRSNIFKPYSYNLQKSVPHIKATQPSRQENTDLYNNYAKIAVGNFGAILWNTELYLPTDDNKIIGINLNHLSYQKGAVDGGSSASTQSSAELFGKIIGKEIVFSSSLGFGRVKENFYGYTEIPNTIDFFIENQQFNFFHANVKFDDANKKDSWNYNLSLDYKKVSDSFSASEGNFIVKSLINYDEKITLAWEMQSSTYSDITELRRSYIRLNPYYQLKLGEILLNVGFSYNIQNDTTSVISDTKIFPYLLSRYSLSNNLAVYAKLDGGYNFNNYWDITSKNPYVNSSLSIQNEQVDYDFEIGLKGNLFDKFSFELSLGTQSIVNKSIYVNAGTFDSQFDLIYLSKPTKIANVNSSIDYILNEKNSLGIGLKYVDYSNPLGTLPHVPNFIFEIEGSHSFSEKIRLNWNFYSLNGIKTVNPIDGQEKTFSVQDLNLSVHYKINKKLSTFVDVDNLLDQNNQRYLNYTLRGFQLKVGLLYKF